MPIQTDNNPAVQSILRYIKRHPEVTNFNTRELQRLMPLRKHFDKPAIKEALSWLVQRKAIRPVEIIRTATVGRPPLPRYEVHPRFKTALKGTK